MSGTIEKNNCAGIWQVTKVDPFFWTLRLHGVYLSGLIDDERYHPIDAEQMLNMLIREFRAKNCLLMY